MGTVIGVCICVYIVCAIISKFIRSVAIRDIHTYSSTGQTAINKLQTARKATEFVRAYRKFSDSVRHLMSLRKYAPTQEVRVYMDNLFRSFESFSDEGYQALLREVIRKQKDDAIANIKWGARKSERRKMKEYDQFVADLDKACGSFSKETRAFADKAVNEVMRATGLMIAPHTPYSSRA